MAGGLELMEPFTGGPAHATGKDRAGSLGAPEHGAAAHERRTLGRRLRSVGRCCRGGRAGESGRDDIAGGLRKKLESPRAIWLMVRAAGVDASIQELVPLLDAGDRLIDYVR